jgi:CubicO group peptidase (beta-lactamase class C family)
MANMLRRIVLSGYLIAAGGFAQAQTAPQLPPPEKTDPAALQMMQGFPPPPEKTVTLGSVLRVPANSRWANQHLRELGPTVSIWRGSAGPSPLKSVPRDLDALAFEDDKATRTTLADWQKATYTDAVLVMHKGAVVYERYHAGLQQQTPHVLWSMTKSLTGLLAGIAIHEGKIDPKAKVAQYLPELAESAWGDATVQQTLDMTTGVRYGEDITNPKAEIFQYLISNGLVPAPASYPGPRTMFAFLKGLAKDGEHDKGFIYKTVDTEIIGWMLQRAYNKTFAELLSEKIWRGIGAEEDAFVWTDPNGAQVTSIGVSATLRDVGRFGEMIRQGGELNGKRVVPKAVIEEIRKGGDREKFKASGLAPRFGYSYHNHWWISHDAAGSFEAKGLNGQHLHINPAAELVIVKLSSHPAGNTILTHNLDRRAFEAVAKAVSVKAGAK